MKKISAGEYQNTAGYRFWKDGNQWIVYGPEGQEVDTLRTLRECKRIYGN